jgi:hypothetical protein
MPYDSISADEDECPTLVHREKVFAALLSPGIPDLQRDDAMWRRDLDTIDCGTHDVWSPGESPADDVSIYDARITGAGRPNEGPVKPIGFATHLSHQWTHKAHSTFAKTNEDWF